MALFKAIISRSVTPKQLDDIKKANENFSITKNVIKAFLSLNSFQVVSTLSVSIIEKEIKAYNLFKERNKKLQHFAHIFQEFARGKQNMQFIHANRMNANV